MAKIPESELIINSDGSVFHLHILPEDLADIVILVGDQGRVPMVASYFEEIEFTKQSREFMTITGSYHGKRITVLSTGIGTDNIDIVMTELDALANIDFATREPKKEHKTLTILRIGTSGGLQPDINIGDYVFSKMTAGTDGLLNWYKGIEKISDKEIEEAFMEHIGWNDRLTTPYFVPAGKKLAQIFSDFKGGITMSAPGFYGPQGRSVRAKIAFPDFTQKLESFNFKGLKVTNIEMEKSAIVGLSSLLGHNAGTICLIIANRYAKESCPDYKPLMEGLIKTALDRLTE